MRTKLKASLLFLASCLTGCSDKPAPSEAESNIYQKAVYHNEIRPQTDKDRDARRKPVDVLEFSGVKPGDTVIDLLGGGGYYTELLSHVVGDKGHVYLVNSPLFVNFTKDQIQERLANNRLKNVTRIDGPWNDLGMPEKADAIFIVLGYHDIYVPRPNNPAFEADPDAFFQQIHASLKPSGKLLVIDHAAAKGTGKTHASSLHRIEEAFAKQDFENHGFVFESDLAVLRNPNDDFSKDIWAKGIMQHTDRFIHLYRKPTSNE